MKSFFTSLLQRSVRSLMFFISLVGWLHAQQSYTFTNCGATGSVGPTQTQVNNAYNGSNLQSMVTTTNYGIQTWTVPYTGTFRIEARGAQGGTSTSTGGLGATMIGDFALTGGEVLWILVGQQGEHGLSGISPAGGGGGSFVVRTPYTTTTTALLIAGGGTGGGAYTDFPGLTTTSGGAGGGGAGTNGSGGIGGNRGAGGGGFLSDGGPCSASSTYANPGEAFVNGGRGGAKPNNTTCYSSTYFNGIICQGGFGGGSSHGGNCFLNGGAGGGFSGGGGSSNGSSGGGGSLNQGSNQSNTQGNNSGDGKVIITEYCAVTMSVNGSPTSTTVCSGSSLTLTTNAISNYSWSTGSSASSLVVTPTVTTVYSLTATSPSNCVSSAVLTIIVQQAVPALTVVNTASTSGGFCPGNSVTLTATGANTYTWTGAQTVTNGVGFAPTTTSGYTVTGKNACGTSTAATSLSVHPLPSVGASISQPTICSGQTFTLNATGNATNYAWSNNVPNGQSSTAGTSAIYTVTGTSSLSCTNTATVSLAVVATPVLAPVLSTVSICQGGQATITASGATGYTWYPQNTNAPFVVVSPTIPTTYTVVKVNANCYDTKTITLHVNALPYIYAVTSDATVCASKPTTLTAGGGLTYNWLPTGGTQYTAIVAPTITTVYTVAASDGSCSSSNTVIVYTNPNPIINVAATATSICSGESVTINVTGALTYTWSDQSLNGTNVTVSPTVSTMYTVLGTNVYTCTSAVSQVIVVNPLPILTATRTKTLVCAGFPSTLTSSGAQAYSWNSGGAAPVTTVYPLTTTVYTVTGTFTSTGCKNTKTVEVAVFHPTFTSTSNTAICAGGSILLTAGSANSYTWLGLPAGQPSVMPNVMVTPTVATEYTVIANSSSPGNYVACLSARTVSVGIYTNPTITAVAQRTLICRKEFVTLSGGGGSTYVWSHGPSGSTVEVNPSADTKYTVTGTDAYNCVNTATLLVKVSTCPGFEENQIGLTGLSVFPNPNNGTFLIKSDVTIKLELRNQLGQLVETFVLDGKNNHQAEVKNLASGIYFVTGTYQEHKVIQKIMINQ